MSAKCPKCHSENPDTQSFCGDCGTHLAPSNDIPSITKTLETPIQKLTIDINFAERYKILEELGKGGMGEVYRVKDEKLDEEMALKVLKPEIAAAKSTLERFKNELKLTRKIAHRNVCKMHDFHEENETPYITMEYVQGEDLKSFIRREGELAEEKVIAIAKQACEGLAEAHGLGVVHRDLKPQNIMIDKNGQAKIMDFGIARFVEGEGVTEAGVIIGTPDYISPEQAEGEKADQRSDIYSLGVILYEMVTGQIPFQGETAFSVALKHKTQLPQNPRKLNPDISEDLSRLILICMEKDTQRRYQTAEELLADLRNIEDGLPLGTKIRPRRETYLAIIIRKKLFIPAMVVTIAILAVIIWQLLPQKAPPPISPDRTSLAILYFENTSGSERLDGWRTALSDLMITDLAQSKFIHVLSGDRIFSILKELNLLGVSRYSAENLIKVANEGRISHVGYGGFIQAGNKIIINFVLKNPHTDDIISSVKKECEGEEEIPARVDELTDEIKLALNLSQEQIASDIDGKVGHITTSSPQALKYYAEGRLYQLNGEFAKAHEMYKKAVEMDSEFAMAYRKLGTTATTQEEQRRYRKKAFQLRDKVSERERYSIEGTYYTIENNFEGAIEAYEKLLQLYPEEGQRGNLISIFSRLEHWEKALEHVEISLRFFPESIYPPYRAAWIYRGLNQYENAQKIIEEYMKKVGDHPWFHESLVDIYFDQGKYDLAHAEIDKAISMRPAKHSYVDLKADIFLCQGNYINAQKIYQKLFEFDTPMAHIRGRIGLGNLSLFKGKLKQAQQEFREGIGLAIKAGDKRRKAFLHRRIAYTFQKMGNLKEAIKELDKAWKLAVEEEDFEIKMFTLYKKGVVQSKMGLMDEVQKTAVALNALIESGLNKKNIKFYHNLMGLIEFESGNYSRAIEYFSQALSLFSYSPLTRRSDFIESLALAFYESWDTEKARKEYEKITRLTTGKRGRGDIYAKSFYMLGKIYEEKSNSAKAIEHYEKFLSLWKDADPGIAEVEVEDARKRLAGLKSK